MKRIQTSRSSKTKILSILIGLFGLMIMMLTPLNAAASGQSFSYKGNAPTNGMLMSLVSNSDVVEPATASTVSSLVGVVAPSDDAFGEQPGRVNVQTDGLSNAFVSTIDGDIRAGDRITISAVAGTGTKAKGSGWIIGTAQESFKSSSSNAVETQITASDGSKKTVYVGTIPVSVKVAYYTSQEKNIIEKTLAPTWLQNLANLLANREVSTTALILSFVIFITGLIAAIVIVTNAIQGSFMSIARQPLAKSQIVRVELRSLAVAGGVLFLALTMSYLLLRVL